MDLVNFGTMMNRPCRSNKEPKKGRGLGLLLRFMACIACIARLGLLAGLNLLLAGGLRRHLYVVNLPQFERVRQGSESVEA